MKFSHGPHMPHGSDNFIAAFALAFALAGDGVVEGVVVVFGGGTSSRRSLSFDVVSSLWNCRRFVAVHKCRSLSFDVVPSLWNCRRFDAVHKCHMLWSVLKWLPFLSLFRGTDFVTAYACQPIGLMVLALLSLFQRADFVTASLCLGLGLDLF